MKLWSYSWWNTSQLHKVICFTEFRKIMTSFLVRLTKDTVQKPDFCRKSRSEITKCRHNDWGTVFYCIWHHVRDIWHDYFHISAPLIAAALQQNITPISSLFFLMLFFPAKIIKFLARYKIFILSTWIYSPHFTDLTKTSDKINAKVNSYQESLSAIGMLSIEAFIYFTLVST